MNARFYKLRIRIYIQETFFLYRKKNIALWYCYEWIDIDMLMEAILAKAGLFVNVLLIKEMVLNIFILSTILV